MATYILCRSGVFHDPDQGKRTLNALNDQRNLSQFCDVLLRVSGTQIYAHSNVLAAASPYFGSFLGTGVDCPRLFSQKHPQIIEIHIDAKDGDGGYGEAVSKVVEYMYTNQITLSNDLVCQVIEIGKIMQMDTLLEYCERFQNGENSNESRDVSTCTTGLQEIASLLGSRSKTVKRIDAATETEEILLKKVGLTEMSSAQLCSTSDSSPLSREENISDRVEENESAINSKTDNQENSDPRSQEELKRMVTTENTALATKAADQNDASLLLAISNVRPPVAVDEKSTADKVSNDKISKTEYPTDDCLSNVKTLADMMSITVEKLSDETNSAGTESSQPNSTTAVGSLEGENLHREKEINLDDISDLVRFDPVTTARFHASTGSTRGGNRVVSTGRPRGRPRGSYGRSWGTRRKRGRPRKVVEEPESDPEFEEFMDRLEKGDNVVSEQPADDDTNTKMDVDGGDNSTVGDRLLTTDTGSHENESVGKWKSRRRRSKPTQLRKDYIMHSLTRRSRQQQGAVKIENNGLNSSSGVKTERFGDNTSKLKFVCQKCDFSTSHFKEYRQHMKTHPETDPRYFICEKCNFKTTKAREFNAHKQKHLSEEFICSYCEQQSNGELEFIEHLKKHAGDLPYFCTECDSRFKTSHQLIAHKPKHQLEKPFVCAICNSGFKWKHALKNHMITHSATKDHLCDVCGYATAHKSQLKAHKLIHTGHMFKCPVQGCQFEATKRQNLKYHMVTHTHEKPHQCDICGQSFSLIKNMRRHMLLHTDTRPFSCNICSFSTTRYDKLKEHNHKLHSIGEAPVSKKERTEENVALLGSNHQITYVSTDGITINTEGTISEETLQTIAQLASAQNITNTDLQGTTINIEQTAEDGTVYPIIATVQSYTDSSGEVQYIAEVPE